MIEREFAMARDAATVHDQVLIFHPAKSATRWETLRGKRGKQRKKKTYDKRLLTLSPAPKHGAAGRQQKEEATEKSKKKIEEEEWKNCNQRKSKNACQETYPQICRQLYIGLTFKI